jgi:RNA polymerase sigma-70 factor (ECF subfamily)
MSESDDSLAEKLKAGDESAFQFLYDRHSKSLLRHLLHMMGNVQEAEDILHESFMLLIRKINFYEPRSDLSAGFKTWFYRLATHRAIDEIRKRKKRSDNEEEIYESEDEKYERKEFGMVLENEMRKLPALQRTVLSLRVHDDLSYLEIALICGKDVNSIKQSLFQARRTLKNQLVASGGMS